jgi:hypothetical protein
MKVSRMMMNQDQKTRRILMTIIMIMRTRLTMKMMMKRALEPALV